LEARIAARLHPLGPVMVAASTVLSDLFEDLDLPANKQVAVNICQRMQRALAEIGISFEPDARYGLPARIRPDTQLALFFEEQWPSEEASDAFHLAQAALVLSAIGTNSFNGLEPLRLDEIEARLPYRHRFSDREWRRLDATFMFAQRADEPRALVKSWPRFMKRHQRVADLDRGFGIAFHAQAGDPLVKRFATAVSKALHADDRRVKGFLREVHEQASHSRKAHDRAGPNLRLSTGVPCETPGPLVERLVNAAPSPSPMVEGLPHGLVEILLALLEGPCSRIELNEISLRHQVRVSGALEQLNDWSLQKLKRNATRGHSTVRINPDAYEPLRLLVAKP